MQYLSRADFDKVVAKLLNALEAYAVDELSCQYEDAQDLALEAAVQLWQSRGGSIPISATADDIWILLCGEARDARRAVVQQRACRVPNWEATPTDWLVLLEAGTEAPIRDREEALEALAQCLQRARGREKLTILQEMVLHQLLDGYRQCQVAEYMGVSPSTVSEHASRAAAKVLAVRNRVQQDAADAREVYLEIQHDAQRSIYHAPPNTGAALATEHLRALQHQDQRHAALCRRKRLA